MKSKTSRISLFSALFAAVFLSGAGALDAQDAQNPAGGGGWRRGNDAEGGGRFRGERGERGARGEFGGGPGGRFGGMGGGGRFPRRPAPAERASYAPLELRGIMGRGENALISITNPETGESQWVRLRDERAKWYVESMNLKNRSVVVRLHGMVLKLEMIPTSSDGTPGGFRPPPVQVATSAEVAGRDVQTPSSGGAFDPATLASQMLAFQAGGQQSTPEQIRAFGEQMRSLTMEQRTQLFEQLRALRGNPGGAAPPSQPPAAQPATQPATLPATLPAPIRAASPGPEPGAVQETSMQVRILPATEIVTEAVTAPPPPPPPPGVPPANDGERNPE
jgi:hypothetical protein